MFKSWDQLTVVEQLQSEYSDFHKEVHGFRPRFANDEQWNSEEWLNAQLTQLSKESDELALQEAANEKAAVEKFELQVDAIIACGAKTREDALRWILDANDATDDPDCACYKLNLPYGYFRKAA